LAEFPTRNDLFRIARDTVLGLNAQLSAQAVQRDGTDVNIMLAAASAMGDAVVGQSMMVCSGQFLDSAEGDALDRYAFDRFGLVRKPAAPSLGTVQFSLTVASITSFAIPAGTALSTSDGVQFVSTVATTFPAASVGPVYVAVRSVLAGADQQAKIAAIINIASTIAGAADGLAVTNSVATAGAADREDDSGLRDRCRRFWTTAQKGTLAALELGALAVPGVVTASAVEVLDSSGRPGRWVQLLIADRFTLALAELNETSSTYDAQSQSLATTVFNALVNVRCGGMYVQPIVAQVVLLQSRLDLTFSAGVDTASVSDQARAAVVNYTNDLAPGAPFVPADAVSALRSVAGLVITGNEIAVPAGKVLPRAMQVIRSTFDLVTATNQGASVSATTNPDFIITT